jgi:WD40 repeat protein
VTSLRADVVPPSDVTTTAGAALEVLRDECVACHRSGKAKGGLKLESFEAFKAGGESGPLINKKQVSESLLLSVISSKGDPHMPPKKQLTEVQIAAVRAWLEAGVSWDAGVMQRPPRVQPVILKPLPKSVHPVLAVTFSPDAQTLAVARGGSIELRNTQAGNYTVKATINASVDVIQSLLWLSDSQTLVAGGFRRIQFWNALEGGQAGVITEGITGDVTALCSQGGTLWAADSLASRGGFIHRISLAERQIQQTWKAHDDSVYGLAVSLDGTWLASAGADRLARLWNPQSGLLAATYEGHTNQVLAVVFDPKNPRLATTGADREIKIWDRDSREQDAVLGDKKQVTSALFWSQDGSSLSSVTDRGNGAVFSAIQKHTGEQSSVTSKVQKLEKVNAVLQCVSSTADGSYVAAGASDGRIFVWNGRDGKLVPIE